MHEVLVNRLGGLSLPRKSVVRLTDRPDMTLDVYRGRKTTIQQQLENKEKHSVVYASQKMLGSCYSCMSVGMTSVWILLILPSFFPDQPKTTELLLIGCKTALSIILHLM